MRVILISPKSPVENASKREKAIQFSRLTLTTIAALFPEETEIKLVKTIAELLRGKRIPMIIIATKEVNKASSIKLASFLVFLSKFFRNIKVLFNLLSGQR